MGRHKVKGKMLEVKKALSKQVREKTFDDDYSFLNLFHIACLSCQILDLNHCID